MTRWIQAGTRFAMSHFIVQMTANKQSFAVLRCDIPYLYERSTTLSSTVVFFNAARIFIEAAKRQITAGMNVPLAVILKLLHGGKINDDGIYRMLSGILVGLGPRMIAWNFALFPTANRIDFHI